MTQSKPDQMSEARALVERLREDVFYGEERMHKMHKHNPLPLEAADALTAALEEIERLRSALQECVEAIDLHGNMYPAMVKGYTLDTLNKAREALKGES